MSQVSRSFRYPISPLEAVVLIQNVLSCPDAENDADRTVKELISEIDSFDGYLSKGVLEAALYCCNMNDEDPEGEGWKFWHPYDVSFDKFLIDILPKHQQFDKYYNVLYEGKEDGLND